MANKDFKVKNGIDIQSPLPVTMGGTGQTTANNTLNALLPSQVGNASKVLSTDGTSTTWVAQSVAYQRGGTASRPGSPTIGDLYYNTDNNYFESYTANGWFPIAAAPSAPTGVAGTNYQPTNRAYNNGQIRVTYTPNTSGGAPTSYIITPSPATSPTTFTTSNTTYDITGLTSGTTYTFTVQSTSPYGTSSASTASSGVIPTTVPQAPTIGSPTAGDSQVSLDFTAGNNGGSAITNYKYSTDGNTYTAFSPAQTSSPVTITGLTNGASYNFYLKAVNANGDSLASSASSSVTPNPPNIYMTYSYTTNNYITSTNGTTWTSRTFPVSGNQQGMTIGNKVIGVYLDNGNSLTSSDGINWTNNSGGTPAAISNVGYSSFSFSSGKHLVFYGQGNTNMGRSDVMRYSTDAKNWSNGTMPYSSRWSIGASSGSLFMISAGIYGDYTTHAATSSNGTTWTARTMPVNANWQGCVWDGSKFVLNTGENSNGGQNYVAWSTDGSSISYTQIRTGYAQMSPISYNGTDTFLIYIGNSGDYYTSSNGTSWTTRTGSLNTWSTWGITGYVGKFYSAEYGSNFIRTSTDGITWSNTSIPTGNWAQIKYGSLA